MLREKAFGRIAWVAQPELRVGQSRGPNCGNGELQYPGAGGDRLPGTVAVRIMAKERSREVEWPTVGLIAAVYAVLMGLVWFHASLPWWVILPVGAYCAALYSFAPA